MTLETKNVEKTPEFEAEATDDDGNVAAVVQGGDKTTFTCGGYTDEGINEILHDLSDGILYGEHDWKRNLYPN